MAETLKPIIDGVLILITVCKKGKFTFEIAYKETQPKPNTALFTEKTEHHLMPF